MQTRKIDLDELPRAMDTQKIRLEDTQVMKRNQPDIIVDRVTDVHNDALFTQFNDYEFNVLAVAEAFV